MPQARLRMLEQKESTLIQSVVGASSGPTFRPVACPIAAVEQTL
jgi:hypothetical protein